ncbi:MAG: hypothetical protein HRU50_14120 [Winogradskyella sp.]|uniref:hypothetical protein n=1 Tax=Winogradskyella sp. TaxID=1883156 RepID=UPI0025D3FB39|nr:hypothetical protein [Winogradskyella sp.]NRB61063.1 hypothetical protein [Winogradskyella sp.]
MIIFFIPVVGSIIYLITQVYNKRDAEKIQNEITSIINPTKKIKDLERQIQFSDTYSNRIELAEAYIDIKDYTNAISQFQHTLKDKDHNHNFARQQLVLCYFEIENYTNAVQHAEVIKDNSDFKGSKYQFCYGLALKELGRVEEAEMQLKQIDRPFSNYNERLDLARFYIEHDRLSEAKELLNEIAEESQHMTKPNRRIYSNTIAEVKRLLKSL